MNRESVPNTCPGEARLARGWFDFGVVWLEYLPFFLALLVEAGWKRMPRSTPGKLDSADVR